MSSTVTSPPASASTSPADELITQRIAEACRALWWAEIVRRGVLFAILFMSALLVWAIIDQWIYSPGTLGRVIAWIVLVAATVWYFIQRIYPILTSRVRPEYAARSLERDTPELRQDLTSYLTLRDQSQDKSLRGRIVRSIGSITAKQLRTNDSLPSEATGTLAWWIAGACVLALLAIYTVFSPKNTFASAGRLLVPVADIEPAKRVEISEVQPGDTSAIAGRAVDVSAKVEGLHADEPVTCRWESVSRDEQFELNFDDQERRFQGKLQLDHSISGTVRYFIEAGDDTAGPFVLDVENVPVIAIQSVHYQPPAYTGEKPHTSSSATITAVDGTNVTIRAKTNRPISKATLEFNPRTVGETVRATAGSRSMTIAEDGTSVSLQFPLRRSGSRSSEVPLNSYRLRVWDDAGQSNPDPIVYPIRVIPDLPPEVSIVMPRKSPKSMGVDLQQLIEVHAMDPDFGLKKVELEIRRGIDVVDQPILWADPNGKKGNHVTEYRFRPSEHGLRVGDTVRIKAIATDNRLDPDDESIRPNVKETDAVEIRIVDDQPAPDPNAPNDGLSEPDRRPASDHKKQDDSTNSQSKEVGQKQGGGGSGKGEASESQSGGGGQSGESGNQSSNSNPGEPNDGSDPGDSQSGGGGSQDSASKDSKQSTKTGNNGDPSDSESKNESGGNSSSDSSGDSSTNQQPQNADSQNNSNGQQPKDGMQENGNQQPQNGAQQPNDPGGKNSNGAPNQGQSGQGKPDARSNDSPGEPDQNSGPGSEGSDSQGDQSAESESPKHDGEAFEKIRDYIDRKQQENAGGGGSKQQQPDGGNNQQGGDQSDGNKADAQNNGSQSQNDNNKGADQSPDSNENGSGASQSQENDPNGMNGDSEKGDSQGASNDKDSSSDPSPSGNQDGSDQNHDQNQQQGSSSKDGSSDPQDRSKQGGDNSKQPQGSQGKPDQNDRESADEPRSDGSSDPTQNPESKSGSKPKPGEQGAKQDGMKPDGSGDSRDSTESQSPTGKQNSSDSGEQSSDSQNSDSDDDSMSDQQGRQADSTKQDPSNIKPNPDNQNPDQRNPDNINDQGKQSSDTLDNPQSNQDSPQPRPDQKSTGESKQPSRSNQQPPSGTTANGADAGTGSSGDSAPPPPAKPDLEYTKKATDMVLDYLEETRDAPDRELLEELDWSEEDLRRFADRWQKTRELPSGDAGSTKPNKDVQDALESLGLRPPGSQKGNTQRQSADGLRGLRDSGNRRKAPAAYRDIFEAFRRNLGRK